jgi:CheY-like chemotaxis protein
MAEAADRLVRRVIVVDDEKNIRRTLQMVLEGEGYTVEVMRVGRGAVPALLNESPVDAVILDVRLPGMDGLEALERIRTEAPETNVLMISGHGRHRLLREAARPRARAGERAQRAQDLAAGARGGAPAEIVQALRDDLGESPAMRAALRAGGEGGATNGACSSPARAARARS